MMITGGTGSFGNAVLNRFLETDIGEIRIFSRDEKKQDDMRHAFQAGMPQAAGKLKFFLGDVRDLQSVKDAIHVWTMSSTLRRSSRCPPASFSPWRRCGPM